MHPVTGIVLGATAAASVGIAVADLARAGFVLTNTAEVHVPEAWLPRLAILKMAGGLGLLLWFVGVPGLPIAAAAGLSCFFAGAITAHVRARVIYNLAFPAAFLGLAVASLMLLLFAGHR
jgi:DoxX-like family